jgi:ankyrin repeat protein
MKKLFVAIRNSDLDTVKQLIEKKPELVNCVAKQPPKNDDGQSPLQVAFKTGNVDIAEYLIDAGANVNFIEDESCCNTWRTPVLHDAINCAVMNCRWNTNDKLLK